MCGHSTRLEGAAGGVRLPALLGGVSIATTSVRSLKLTYPIFVTKSNKSEAHRDHSRVYREGDSFCGVLELATGGFGQASRHEGGQRACAERIARGGGLDHIVAFVE